MPTVFKLLSDCLPLDLDRRLLQSSLAASMKVQDRDDGTYVVVDHDGDEESENAQRGLNRELDRIFFLTSVRVTAELANGPVSSTLSLSWNVHGHLPATIEPQCWTPELALQLRLWRIAADATDPPFKILLLFQIVELSYPDTNKEEQYPTYTHSSCSPHPRTEAKLLRNLVAHAGKPTRKQTENYLKYLGLPSVLSDRTNAAFLRAVSAKVSHIEEVARQIIERAV